MTNTIAGFVYMFGIAGTSLYKIGYSVSPATRFEQIQSGTGGLPLYFEAASYRVDARAYEREFHRKYTDMRVNGEWYKLTPEQVAALKADMIVSHNCQGVWEDLPSRQSYSTPF